MLENISRRETQEGILALMHQQKTMSARNIIKYQKQNQYEGQNCQWAFV